MFVAAAVFPILLLACSGRDEPQPPTPAPAVQAPTPAPTVAPTATVPAVAPTAEPTVAPTATAEPVQASGSSGGVTVLVSEGSVARYSVTEQLARLPSPIDAVGETGDVEGAIVFDADGNVDPERSVITVALAGLTSDEDRRDRYVREIMFNTRQHPNVELRITGVEGLDWPFPDSGETTFRLMGDMTVEGVASPTTWDVEARASEGAVSGQARTVVTFEQFEVSKPRLAFIISVEDEIRLELDIEAAIERE